MWQLRLKGMTLADSYAQRNIELTFISLIRYQVIPHHDTVKK